MKRLATYRRGWNAALRQMRASIGYLPPEWQRSGPIIAALCRELRMHKPRGGTNAELGLKYSASVRTIVYWRKAGCPFEQGKPAVLRWLATRRSVPPRMEKRHGDRLGTLRLRHWLSAIKADFRMLRALRRVYRRKRWPVPDWVARL